MKDLSTNLNLKVCQMTVSTKTLKPGRGRKSIDRLLRKKAFVRDHEAKIHEELRRPYQKETFSLFHIEVCVYECHFYMYG